MLASKPGVPALVKEASKYGFAANSSTPFITVHVVRPLQKEQGFLCRVPKSAAQLKESYQTLSIAAQDLTPLVAAKNRPENLLDGSLYPNDSRPVELLIHADFVTCTQ
jgi:hypothetical protein